MDSRVLNRIREQELVDRTCIETFHRARALSEDAVRDRRHHRDGTGCHKPVRRLGQGTHGQGEVIDQDGVAAGHLADQMNGFDRVFPKAPTACPPPPGGRRGEPRSGAPS